MHFNDPFCISHLIVRRKALSIAIESCLRAAADDAFAAIAFTEMN